MQSHSSRAQSFRALLALAGVIAVLTLGSSAAVQAEPDSRLDRVVDRYAQATGHKALALTDGPRTAWAFSASHSTREDAIREAVALCRSRADGAGIDAECRVVAVDDRAVDSRVESRRLARSASRRR